MKNEIKLIETKLTTLANKTIKQAIMSHDRIKEIQKTFKNIEVKTKLEPEIEGTNTTTIHKTK